MKNAIMFHGSGETPNSFWYPGIKRFLEELGYEVWSPQLPKPDVPELKVQLPYVLEKGRFDEETVLVGHSAGCPLILSVLENIKVRVSRAVLVAGFSRNLRDGPNAILQERYDWEKIKRNVRDKFS
jgi:predicted alpha/beta hydrolase family esterase